MCFYRRRKGDEKIDISLAVLIFPSFFQPFDKWPGNIPGFVGEHACSIPFSFSKNGGILRNQTALLHKWNTYWSSGQGTGKEYFCSANRPYYVAYTTICP